MLIFLAHAHAVWSDPMICPRNEGADYCEGFAKYAKMGLLRAGNLLIFWDASPLGVKRPNDSPPK